MGLYWEVVVDWNKTTIISMLRTFHNGFFLFHNENEIAIKLNCFSNCTRFNVISMHLDLFMMQ